MANTTRPLQEKMTLFWHGLLTSQLTQVKDPTAMVAQNELYREHAMDAFPDILKSVTQDPAMMVYLNIDGSNKQAPNENYARELMELFSLGVGNYTEQDVREGARAFTGWRVPRQRVDDVAYTLQQPVYLARRFDDGYKTFLGESGYFGADDVIDIIVKQPASAQFIVRKLFSFFVFPGPSDDDIAPFVEIYQNGGQQIGPVVEAMLRSDVFYSPQAYRAIIKSPTEYAVGAIKALGLQTDLPQLSLAQGRAAVAVLTSMGQVLFEPPNVAGWPGGTTWLNSATMFGRLNFLNLVTGGGAAGLLPGPRAANRDLLPDPPAFAQLQTAGQALDYFLPLVLDGNVSDDARQVLLDYAGGADAPLDADVMRGLIYLVLGSPQFHLA